MPGKGLDIIAPFPKRKDVDPANIKPVVKIASKPLISDLFLYIFIYGRNDPCLYLKLLVGPQGPEYAGFNKPEKACLDRHIHIGYFVYK